MKKHNRTEKDWDAIWDAETLARAEVIKSDTTRMKAAIAWAKKLVEEEEAEADAMGRVSEMTATADA